MVNVTTRFTEEVVSLAESCCDDADKPTAPEDGYLYRTIEITEQWQQLAQTYFGISGQETLWGGRPDILIERYSPGSEQPTEVFAGEVKYTRSRSYAAQGFENCSNI